MAVKAIDPGRRIYGAAALLMGLIGYLWGDFASVWQPVPKDLPGYALLAYLAATLFLFGGISLQWRRTAPWGGLAIGLLVLTFDIIWIRRVAGFPAIFGTWLGLAEETGMALGALILWTDLLESPRREVLLRGCEIAFGLCAVGYGVAHFLILDQTAILVPRWLPPGQTAWAYITGACDIAGGVALLADRPRRLASLAASLLGVMYAVFGLLIWLPRLFAQPEAHMSWAGNAVNLTLVATAWALASRLHWRSELDGSASE